MHTYLYISLCLHIYIHICRHVHINKYIHILYLYVGCALCIVSCAVHMEREVETERKKERAGFCIVSLHIWYIIQYQSIEGRAFAASNLALLSQRFFDLIWKSGDGCNLRTHSRAIASGSRASGDAKAMTKIGVALLKIQPGTGGSPARFGCIRWPNGTYPKRKRTMI